MVRPDRISQHERDRIAELHTAGWSRAAIARDIGRAASTVGKVAEQLGLSFDRSQTAAATEARTADLAARRAELAGLLLDDAFRLRERLWTGYTVLTTSPLGEVVRHEYDLPPAAETRNLMTSVAVAVDKHLALVKADQDAAGGAAVDSWLIAMLGSPG